MTRACWVSVVMIALVSSAAARQTSPFDDSPRAQTDPRRLLERAIDRVRRSGLPADKLEHFNRVIAEIEANPEHPWAGIYIETGGCIATPVWAVAPTQGAVFWDSGATDAEGHPAMFTVGSAVAAEDGALTIRWARRDGTQHTQVRFPVRWGDRLYLMRDYEIEALCQEVNAGQSFESLAQYWGGYLRIERTPVGARGTPQIPERFNEMLLAEPVQGKILDLTGPLDTRKHPYSGEAQTRFRVTIDAGSEAGVFLSLSLYVPYNHGAPSWRNECRELRVIDIKPDCCVAEGWVTAREGEWEDPLQPGMRVSSRRR